MTSGRRAGRWLGGAALVLVVLFVAGVGWIEVADASLRAAFVDATSGAPSLDDGDGADSSVRRGPASDGPDAGSFPEGAAPPTEYPAVRLKVLTYNVWALPVPLPGLDRANRLPRIPGALAAEEADVVALQEAFDVRFRDFVGSYFEGGLELHRSTWCEESLGLGARKDCSGGLMTLSRFPTTEQRFEAHATVADMKRDERMSGKGFMVSTLATDVGPVEVLNVHLYAGREPEDEEHRLRQLRRVGEALGERASTERPVVLLGDLNVVHPSLAGADGHPESSAFAFLLDSLHFVQVAPGDDGMSFTYDTVENPYAGVWYNRWEGRQIFDYVMVRLPPGFEVDVGAARLALAGSEPLSDHFGVLAELTISRVEPPGP